MLKSILTLLLFSAPLTNSKAATATTSFNVGVRIVHAQTAFAQSKALIVQDGQFITSIY